MADVKIKGLHHVSLAVNDAQAVMDTWEKVFGISNWRSVDLSGTDAKGRPWKAVEYQAEVGDNVIEVIQPIEGRIVQSRFLDELGPGFHHVAFKVEDVEESLAALEENGAELIVHNPGSFAYVRTGGPDGAVVEISKH